MVVAYDASQVRLRDLDFLLPFAPTFHRWSHDGATQRERMLAAFVFLPPLMHGPHDPNRPDYWMKIDCDVLCRREVPAAFPPPEWFENSPPYVAPRWGYSKPADTIQRLDDWADNHPAFEETKRIDAPWSPDSETVSWPRICSWLSFYSDDYLRLVASLMPDQKMPIPSQDGIHWYVAERLGLGGRKEKMTPWGFKTISSAKRLKEEAAKICLA